MKPIQALDYQVVFNQEGTTALNDLLAASSYSKIFVIVDTNTQSHCLAAFLSKLSTSIAIEVIEIDSGEEHKTISTCEGVWDALAHLDADRKAVVINLGGGVVTDLGGFVASTFKRGMDFINVPTTLLAMVDASVGGKTGVDLGALKNLIGVINNPQMVLIDTTYLNSLSAQEMRSGLAEVYKHGLVASKDYWTGLTNLSQLTTEDLDQIIYDSVIIKNTIVLEDPKEDGLRKALNFGHTLGHAIESYCLEAPDRKRLLHGEAIAIGMILECFISEKKGLLDATTLDQITHVLSDMYPQSSFNPIEIEHIIGNLKYDKKNSNGTVLFVLLESIGSPVLNQEVAHKDIKAAFDYYHALYQA